MPNRFKSIVIIDDNEAELDLTRREFLKYNPDISYHSFTDVEEGIDFISKHIRNGVEAVFIDLYLGPKSGRGTSYVSEVSKYSPYIPVIIISYSDAEEDILEAYRHKITKYVIKPLTVNKIHQLERSL